MNTLQIAGEFRGWEADIYRCVCVCGGGGGGGGGGSRHTIKSDYLHFLFFLLNPEVGRYD